MTERVHSSFEGRDLEFDLDFATMKWSKVGDAPLAEGAFPVIEAADGKRYELYSDGTFGEEEIEDP